jgi:transcriptional regulator NrdR family protein
VYREFGDVDEFTEAIEEVQPKAGRARKAK